MRNSFIRRTFAFFRLNNLLRKQVWQRYLAGFFIIFIIGFIFITAVGGYGVENFQSFWPALVSSINGFYSKIIFSNPASESEPPPFTEDENISEEAVVLKEVELNSDPALNDGSGLKTEVGIGEASAIETVQFSLQEDLDDISEKIDIIKSEIEKLEKNQNENLSDLKSNQENDENQDNIQQENEDNINEDLSEDTLNNENLSNINIISSISVISASGGSVVYPKILISEIQISGIDDEKEEFVELYNPNNEEIVLTDWYLQRKTETGSSYSTFVSNNLFSGKKIGGLEYFIIAREGSIFAGLANIITENSLGDSDSSSTLVLKNPNRGISDKLGFGAPQEYEVSPAKNLEKGKSLGRKWNNDTEQDSDDNSVDFEIQISTPKARNITYVVPAVPPASPDPILTDTTAPQISFNLNQTQAALNFTFDFTVTDPTEAVSPSGLASYIFRWKEGDEFWQEDLEQKVSEYPNSINLTRDFLGEDGKIYYFQVKAKDVLGNDSGWLPENPAETIVNVPKKILINEVCFDEKNKFFIELFNPDNQEVDLTGWYLQRKTETGSDYSSFITKTQFEGKKIEGKNYFLITRQESDFTENADIITDNPLTENNSLVLKNPDGDISDKLGFGAAIDFETAPSLTPETRKSIGRKWVDDSSKDTENNLDDFEIQTPTPKAQNITFEEPPIPADTTPPEVVFDLLEAIQTSLDFTINFEITDPLEVVSPSGVAGYIFRWKEENGEWNEDSFQNFSENPLARNFSGEDQKNYYFQVQATDIAGNESDWSPAEPISVKIDLLKPFEIKPILINEIQIEGQTAKDEFIELYNPNEFDIDILGFSLKKKTSSGTESNLVSSGNFTGIISALGYFLIVPQNNEDGTLNYTGLAVPDLYYSGKSYSVASDNAILLYDKNNNLQDKVGFGSASDFELSPAKNPDKNKSIKRENLGEDTGDNSQDFIISDTPTPGAE